MENGVDKKGGRLGLPKGTQGRKKRVLFIDND